MMNALAALHQAAPDRETTREWLVTRLSQRLAIPPEEIDVREPLASYGLSSIEAVVLSGDLEEWLGRELPATLVWDYPTIEKLTDYLSAAEAG